MQVRIIKDKKGLASLEKVWDQLLLESKQANFFQSYTWIKYWWEYFSIKHNADMHIMVFTVNKKIRVIAPLMIVKTLFLGIPYKTVRFMGTTGTDTVLRGRYDRFFSIDNTLGWCDQCDVIPNTGKFFVPAMDAFIRYILQRKNWDMLDLRELSKGSPTLKYLRDMTRRGELPKNFEKEMQASYSLHIKGHYEAYFATLSKNTRKAFNNSRNRIKKLGAPVYEVARTPSQIEVILPQIVALEQKSWKGENQCGAFSATANKKYHISVAQSLASKKEIEIHYLKINNQMVSFYYCFLYQNRIYLHLTAFDPDLSRLMPSFYLLFLLIERAFQNNINVVDFCRANTFFKTRFKTTPSSRVWWKLYSTRILPRIYYSTEFKLKPMLKSLIGKNYDK
ncbi:MAG: GNAT family N-acetyltransferase [Desulfobacteraceae bacterium]|nr:GNAT family N-acetyltransferase [Desulfobacteraceae bacterium]